MNSDPPPLTWRNASTRNLRDFVGYDGELAVARILQPRGGKDWRWSVFAIEPARAGVTQGYEADPKVARFKVERAWAFAKEHGKRIGAGHMLVPIGEPFPQPAG